MALLPVTQNKRRALIRAAMIGFGLLLLGLVIAARAWDISLHWPMVLALVAFCALAVLEFASFDELARHAHYISWYWGSAFGLIAVVLTQVALGLSSPPFGALREGLARWLGEADAVTTFLAGMMATPLLMAAGFFICRGVDVLRTR